MVRSYDEVKYLSVGANCVIEEMSNIGEVVEVNFDCEMCVSG